MIIGGKKKYIRVHRVIANTWLGVHDKFQVNHKNGIRTDDRLENLEFCTPSEKMKHCFKMKEEGKRVQRSLCAYLLNRYYNLSVTDIQKLISTDKKSIENWISENDTAFSVIEFTDEQIGKIFADSENKDIFSDKELFKKYLKRQYISYYNIIRTGFQVEPPPFQAGGGCYMNLSENQACGKFRIRAGEYEPETVRH